MTGKLTWEKLEPLKCSLCLGKAAAEAVANDIRAFVRKIYFDDESIVSNLSDRQIRQCATDFLSHNDVNQTHSLPSPEALSRANFHVIITKIIKSQCVNLENTLKKRLKEKKAQRSLHEARFRQVLHPAPVAKRVGNVGWDANADGNDWDDSDDVDLVTNPGDHGDDDFNMSAHASTASPGPVRSYSGNPYGKLAAGTSSKRKAEGSENTVKKRFRPACAPSSQYATPIESQTYDNYLTGELAGSHCTEKDALDSARIAISRQSLSHTKNQAHSSESEVNDTIVVALPVTNNVSQSDTTLSGTGNRKNSLGAVDEIVPSKMAAKETGRARNSMSGMITLLKDPEVIRVHGSQQHLHLAGASERDNQVQMHTLAFTIPRLRLDSGPVPNSNQDTQSTSASSGDTMTDLNFGPQSSPSPKLRAQPYTESVIAKVAKMIAAYRQPTTSSETQTPPSTSMSTVGTQTAGTCCSPLKLVALDQSIPSPSSSSSTTLDATQAGCNSSKPNPTKSPLQVSAGDVLCNLVYWRAKQREISQRRDEAIIANK